MYTVRRQNHAEPEATRGVLCLATSRDPTNSTGWIQRSVVFPGRSKSGALLLRETGPHFLYWGAGKIHITASSDPAKWTEGTEFIVSTAFEGWAQQNTGVESGPPPMQLSDGNYLFLHNSWSFNGYVQLHLRSHSVAIKPIEVHGVPGAVPAALVYPLALHAPSCNCEPETW